MKNLTGKRKSKQRLPAGWTEKQVAEVAAYYDNQTEEEQYEEHHIAREKTLPINIEMIIERAFEQAFSKALEQTLQGKAEDFFKAAFRNGSPLAKKLEGKIEEDFRQFIEEGIRRVKKRPGSKGKAWQRPIP
jgi:hypothetical protein